MTFKFDFPGLQKNLEYEVTYDQNYFNIKDIKNTNLKFLQDKFVFRE